MLQKLKEYISNHKLIGRNDRLLLAISGGIDSMVMLHLFQQLPYYFEIAHMNFGLRGEESDADQVFIEQYCLDNNIKLHLKKVNTNEYLVEHKISVQMAARELRYNWFEQLKEQHILKFTLTAHHSDDSIETVFINLIRGTGYKGLKGIVNNEIALRPLLNFSRKEIRDFAIQSNITWREDSSNVKEDYLRNKLRHSILPMIDEVNEQWRENMLKLMTEMETVEGILQQHYNKYIDLIYKEGKIDITCRESLKEFDWLFTQLLLKLGFTALTSKDILNSIDVATGKEFESNTYRIIKGRGFFEVIQKSKISLFENNMLVSNEAKSFTLSSKEYIIQRYPKIDFQLEYQQEEVYLDFHTLAFPLRIRKWEKGDWFIPLGMKGKKKLSDFFIDEKYTINEKENTFVVVSGEDIVCILGGRSDNRYRITENTEEIYHIKLKHD